MNHGTSLYLDLIRFFAAAMVFVTHASYERFTGGWMREIGLGSFGNDAVVVFFVLSGLVIAYVCHAREKTLRDYALSRAARIYSVVIPCLLLTVILDFAGSRINYAPYAGWWLAYAVCFCCRLVNRSQYQRQRPPHPLHRRLRLNQPIRQSPLCVLGFCISRRPMRQLRRLRIVQGTLAGSFISPGRPMAPICSTTGNRQPRIPSRRSGWRINKGMSKPLHPMRPFSGRRSGRVPRPVPGGWRR